MDGRKGVLLKETNGFVADVAGRAANAFVGGRSLIAMESGDGVTHSSSGILEKC
jgi:hypothetical protein